MTTYSIECKMIDHQPHAIVLRRDTNGQITVADVITGAALLDIAFDRYDIGAVRMPDGTYDAGDALSVREVAECALLNLRSE
jgi:hypothetical protein